VYREERDKQGELQGSAETSSIQLNGDQCMSVAKEPHIKGNRDEEIIPLFPVKLGKNSFG
jgi:hypothetical protein